MTVAKVKQTSAGLIPSDWEVTTIGDEFDVSAGGDWDAANSSKFQDGDHPYPVVANALSRDAVQGYCRYFTIPGGALTITGRGDVGKAVYRPNPFVPIVRLVALVPKRGSSARFFTAYINERVNFSQESTGVPQLTAPQVRRYLIACPSTAEQHAIASVLADIDQLIASLERSITKKQAIKQGMMQQLLAGKTRLPGFTDRWLAARFEELAAPALQRVDPQGVPAGTRLVDLEHIDSGGGRLLASATASGAVSLKTVFQPGDVLFGKLRAYLRKYWLADVPGICSTEIWVLRSKPLAENRYVRYLVETDRFIEVASGGYGTHMPRSDWGTLRGLEFEVPPVDEQKAIATVLTEVDDEINGFSFRLAKTKAIKQGMMQELLTGRTRLPVEKGAA